MSIILADNILRCIFMTEKFYILKISLKFVPKGPVDKKTAWVQIMAWRQRCQAIIWSNAAPIHWHIWGTIGRLLNSSRPCDAIWLHRSGSAMGQVMAGCLMAPSHYMIQFQPSISEVLLHSSEGNFTGNAQNIYTWYHFENYLFKIRAMSPRGQWLK